MTIAQKIRTLRTMRGLSQQELALKAGIPSNYISHMESGKVIPAGEWDVKIRKALRWTPEVDAQLDDMVELA